jgi:hypothetical protein
MSWGTICRRTVVVLSLCLSGQVYGLPGLVLGSFNSLDNAEARRAEVEMVLGQPTLIIPAVTQGREVFRVVVAAENVSFDQLKGQAQASALGSGWRYELSHVAVCCQQASGTCGAHAAASGGSRTADRAGGRDFH